MQHVEYGGESEAKRRVARDVPLESLRDASNELLAIFRLDPKPDSFLESLFEVISQYAVDTPN
jgi:hypothetical protein